MTCYTINVASYSKAASFRKIIMTSLKRHKRTIQDQARDKSDNISDCACERLRRNDLEITDFRRRKRTFTPSRDTDSLDITSSEHSTRHSRRKKSAPSSHSSSLQYYCTNIIPKFSLWKLFLLVHLFIVLLQINRCESTAKWWSIASIPSSERISSVSKRPHHPASAPSQVKNRGSHSRTRNDESKQMDHFLTNDKIKEILSSSEITGPTVSEGQGSFENQNKRDVTPNRAGDVQTIERRTKIFPKTITSNFKPPVQLLSRKQRRLLRRNAGAFEEIMNGLKKAVRECKFQFRNRRWVCQTDPRDASLFGKIINRGFRETAFIYAITSAAVSHAIARGCSQGTVESCGCEVRRGMGGPGWEWGGCSDNFKFARKFARDFVDAGEVGTDLKYRMNLHNNRVGRETVEEHGKRFCKCHGMSGSCTLKTCWLRAPPFRVIGRKLRDKCDDAERVTISNHGKVERRDSGLLPAVEGRKPPKKGDLVYFENSPSFCTKKSEYWADGTRGRTCNATSSGLNGCDSMCCGRGFRTKLKTVKQKCKCEFEWCCKVNCQICEVEKEVSTCK